MCVYFIEIIDASLLVVSLSCCLVVLLKLFKTVCDICFYTFQDVV